MLNYNTPLPHLGIAFTTGRGPMDFSADFCEGGDGSEEVDDSSDNEGRAADGRSFPRQHMST